MWLVKVQKMSEKAMWCVENQKIRKKSEKVQNFKLLKKL